MKNIFLITLILGSMVTVVFAQNGERMHRGEERIKSLRIAFLTEKLELTPEESEKFWPIYREMSSKLRALKKDGRKKVEGLKEMSDQEAEAFIKNHFEIEEKVLTTKREYFEKLRTAIPPRKIAMLEPLEKRFKQRLLNRVSKGKRGREMQKEY